MHARSVSASNSAPYAAILQVLGGFHAHLAPVKLFSFAAGGSAIGAIGGDGGVAQCAILPVHGPVPLLHGPLMPL